LTGSRLIIAIGRDLVVSGISESGSSWFGSRGAGVLEGAGGVRALVEPEFASLGMAMPAPGWVVRQGDLKCGVVGSAVACCGP
jgi:hypothetical protein